MTFHFQFDSTSFAYLISAVVAVLMANLVWQRRSIRGGRTFAILMLAVGEWAFFEGLDAAAIGTSGKIFWSKVSYPGIVSTAELLLIFALQYTERDRWLTPLGIGAIFAIPVVTVLLAWTNEWHGLIWSSFTPVPGTNILIYNHGPFFWVAIAYFYLVLMTSSWLLIWVAIHYEHLFRGQALAILISTPIPWIANLLYISGLSPIRGFDLAPISFTLAGLILAIGIFRFQLFDLVPVARDKIFENLSDGLIVVDTQNRIVDINPPALELFCTDQVLPIGKPAGEVCALLIPYMNAQTSQAELSMPGEPQLDFELKITSLRNRQGKFLGKLFLLHDISARKRAEELEVKARKRAEALNEIFQSISSNLDLERFFPLVEKQIKRFFNIGFLLIATYDPESDEWQHLYLSEQREEFEGKKYRSSQGITGYTIQSGKALFLNSRQQVEDFIQRTGRQNLGAIPKAYMSVPLLAKKKVVGALVVQNYEQENPFSEDDFRLFNTIGAQIAIALENARLFNQMEILATIDSTTGLTNRRHFIELAEIELERARRYQRPLSIIMLDVDHFKRINDSFGHSAGDLALKTIAQTCWASLRKVDLIGRYGGEEFVVLMPETGLEKAYQAARRLCIQVDQLQISLAQSSTRVTISLGISSLDKSSDTLDTLLNQADQALYAAKQAGRNQVAIYQPGEKND